MPTYQLNLFDAGQGSIECDAFECVCDEDAIDLARIRFTLSSASAEATLLREGSLITRFTSDRPSAVFRDTCDPQPSSRQPHPARHGGGRL